MYTEEVILYGTYTIEAISKQDEEGANNNMVLMTVYATMNQHALHQASYDATTEYFAKSIAAIEAQTKVLERIATALEKRSWFRLEEQ